jgi:DNA primase
MPPSLDPVQDIKERLSIEQLIGEYLPLKQAGVNLRALCPFHSEKTPSFMVSPDRHSWHCFGCSKGGDVFTFVMEMEALDFREALELLAKKAGVELPKYKQADSSDRTRRLYEVNAAAMSFFEKQLGTRGSAAEVARKELQRRKVTTEVRELFHVGFAPPDWESLTLFLQKQGFTEAELVSAGVCVARTAPKHGTYDRFRNRLTFPLIDQLGRVIGFSARALDPNEKMGKYINSPETPIYHKGRFLFALNLAKTDIRKRNFAILVEGQMDAVSSHRVGVRNVVATSGTALTNDHLQLLKRYTSNLILAFDVDVAGANATKRGIDLAISQGINVKVASMPAGVDPDDLCREDPKAWGAAINESLPIIEYYLKKSLSNRDLTRVEHKKAVAREVLPEVGRLADPVEQTHYLQTLSKLLGVSEEVLRRALSRAPRPTERRTSKPQQATTTRVATQIDPLLHRLARLVAVWTLQPTKPQHIIPLLKVTSDPDVTATVDALEKNSTAEALKAISVHRAELASLIDRELFTLERESENDQDISSGRQEITQLARIIARESLRKELAQLHTKVARAQGPEASQLSTLFVEKTQALTALEETEGAQT